MNNNPLQFVPQELTDCRNLEVLDLNHTYVKTLPIEFSLLKKMYDLNLNGCPLKEHLQEVYNKGIVEVLKYYEDKVQREKYRGLLVKSCKENLWIDNEIALISQAIDSVLVAVEKYDIYLLKRLLRNLKYILPSNIDLVDPHQIRSNLMKSRADIEDKVENPFNQSMSKIGNPQMNKSIKYDASDVDLQQSIYIKEGNHIIPTSNNQIRSQTDAKIAAESVLEGKPLMQNSKESIKNSNPNVEKQQGKLTNLNHKAKP